MGAFRSNARHGEPETEFLGGLITGTGAADPTISEGCNGFTVDWISTGLYEITLEAPAKQCWPLAPGMGATTGTDMDGWTVVFHAYSASTRKIRFRVYSQNQTLSDLAAATWLNLCLQVKLTSARA